ncbi:MAG: hypothetical protein JWQ73_4200 [Variovorax sp.]|nr:hypothetical protein [Variovorax sp.]
MKLRWNHGVVTLQEPDDFKAFKVVVDGDESQFAQVSQDFARIATFDGPGTAWVAQAALRALGAQGRDPAWSTALDAMVEKARPHGWIDAGTGAIKAHVEWVAATPRNDD